MSRERIPKEGNIKRGDTKIKRWNPAGSQGDHGGAKEVPRGCQRKGVHERGNQGEAKVGKGEGAKGGNAKRTFSNG